MKINGIFNLKFQQKFIGVFIIFVISWAFSSPWVLQYFSIEIESIILFSIIRFVIISLILLILIYYINKTILDEIKKNNEENEEIKTQQKKLLIALKNDYFFYRHTPDNYFAYISKSINNILGFSKDEFIQYLKINNITELTESVFERADLFSSDGILIPPIEIELQNRKGEKILFEITESPVFDKNKKLIAVEGIAHKLTAHYTNIVDDLNYKDKYETLFDANENAVLIIKDNKFIDCNENALKIFDTNYEHIIMDSPFSINFSPYKQANGEISRELAIEKLIEAKTNGTTKFNWTHLKGGTEEFAAEVTLIYKQYENEELVFAIVKEKQEQHENNLNVANAENKILEEIFDNSRALLYKLNIETGKYEYLSSSVLELTGYTKEELLSFDKSKLQSLLHPNDLANADSIIAKLISENNTEKSKHSVEYRFLHKSGEYRWFSDSYKIVKAKESSYIVGNVHDITKMVEYREALKNSELRFRKTVDNIQNGISIYENDKIIYVNDRLTEITGYTKEELMQFDSLFDIALPKEKERISKITKTKKKSVEFWINKKNGQKVCINNRYSESFISNDLYGKYVITSDITDQKQLEIALLEREERFRNLTNKLPQAIFETREDGTITFINQSGYNKLGYKPEELINKIKLSNIVSKSDEISLTKKFDEILEGKTIEHLELKIISKNGEEIPYRIYPGVIIRDDKNVGVRGIMIDISDENKAEQEIEIAQKTVNSIKNIDKTLISDILQEMSEPVNSISGMINLIETTKLTEEQYDFLKIISKSSESLSEIIKDINEVAKTDRTSNESFDLITLLSEINKENKERLKKTDTKFLLKQNISEHFEINQGKEKIKLLTNNVISIAQNMFDNGTIELEVKVESKKEDVLNLNFYLYHDGKKLTDEEADIINEIIKNPNDKKNKYDLNDKLKISIINDLVSEFGGKLEFLIGAKGRNIFSYNININYKKVSDNSSNEKLKDIKILLAEDQLFNQMVVKTMARNWDCLIDVVDDGEQAIDKIKQNNYDLILMDIHMPRMDGIESIKYINKNIKGFSTPIIAITGDIHKKITDFNNMGVSNLIIKPFTSQELFKSIVKALGIYSHSDIEKTVENLQKDNNNKIYSLEIINKLAKGNEDIKRKMVRVFVKKTVEELKGLKLAVEQENLDKAFAISHKMKPAFGYLKIEKAEKYLYDIVEQSRNNGAVNDIFEKVELLEKEVNNVIKQLKIDFKNLL